MSWYKDPQLFIFRGADSLFRIVRIKKETGILVLLSDLADLESLDFSKHLSLGHNKDDDYAAFKSSFPQNILKFVNSQGVVVNWDGQKYSGTWSREEIKSPFYNLPTFQQALQRKVSELEAKNSTLQDQIKRKNEEKQRISKLETENSTLQHNVKMSKEKQQIFDDKVSKLEAKIYTMQDEINRNKEEQQSMDKRASELESEIFLLQEQIKGHIEEKHITDTRLCKLEAENATLQDEIKRNQKEKQSQETKVSELDAENSILQNKVKQNNEEKQLMNKKISELHKENSTLQDEVKREKDEKQEKKEKQEKRYSDLETAILHLYDKKAREDTLTVLEVDIARLENKKRELTEDMNTLRNEVTKLQEQLNRMMNNKQCLEEQTSELTLKLKDCRGARSGPSNEKLSMHSCTPLKDWVTFEELDVQPVSDEENTANIQSSHRICKVKGNNI
ncbi:golgin subfamily A member 6-like protein 7 [Papaver somniferum]|uniref:golgin subfamily A member 6-like protein 7 n=1 Tax=Papaver somniferum TaxID=3469 RepID=UPI000E6F815C|nr:golgin subfamily A member 6-like protein 7 [Papaver somniferum]